MCNDCGEKRKKEMGLNKLVWQILQLCLIVVIIHTNCDNNNPTTGNRIGYLIQQAPGRGIAFSRRIHFKGRENKVNGSIIRRRQILQCPLLIEQKWTTGVYLLTWKQILLPAAEMQPSLCFQPPPSAYAKNLRGSSADITFWHCFTLFWQWWIQKSSEMLTWLNMTK